MAIAVTGMRDTSDVMEWETIVDIDPSAEYAYFGQRGEAELGDVNCLEALVVDGVGFERSFPLPGDPSFDTSGAPGEFDELLTGLPFSIVQLEEITGSRAVVDDDGSLLSAVLTDSALDELDGTVFNPNALGGEPVEYGTIDARANADGELRALTIVYESANGEQLVFDATVVDLPDTERVTTADTVESTGWCASVWSDAAEQPTAFWYITAVVDGDLVFDDEIDQTPVLIAYPDGTISGSTGCSDIVGTATITEAGVSEIEVSVGDPSCPDELLARERTVIAALNSGSATIGHAGSVTYGVEDGAKVVLFAVG